MTHGECQTTTPNSCLFIGQNIDTHTQWVSVSLLCVSRFESLRLDHGCGKAHMQTQSHVPNLCSHCMPSLAVVALHSLLFPLVLSLSLTHTHTGAHAWQLPSSLFQKLLPSSCASSLRNVHLPNFGWMFVFSRFLILEISRFGDRSHFVSCVCVHVYTIRAM